MPNRQGVACGGFILSLLRLELAFPRIFFSILASCEPQKTFYMSFEKWKSSRSRIILSSKGIWHQCTAGALTHSPGSAGSLCGVGAAGGPQLLQLLPHTSPQPPWFLGWRLHSQRHQSWRFGGNARHVLWFLPFCRFPFVLEFPYFKTHLSFLTTFPSGLAQMQKLQLHMDWLTISYNGVRSHVCNKYIIWYHSERLFLIEPYWYTFLCKHVVLISLHTQPPHHPDFLPSDVTYIKWYFIGVSIWKLGTTAGMEISLKSHFRL